MALQPFDQNNHGSIVSQAGRYSAGLIEREKVIRNVILTLKETGTAPGVNIVTTLQQ
jgi:hypothetical protein